MSKHIIEHGQYSLEFEKRGLYVHLFVRFWHFECLCRVYVCRSGIANKNLEGELGSFSRLLSAISTEADVVAYSGCSQIFGETLDKSPFFKHGVQYPFRFDEFNLEKMMHKKSYSVFGRIDFFSVLRQLLVSLGGCLEEQWTISAPELSKVVISRFVLFIHGRGVHIVALFQGQVSNDFPFNIFFVICRPYRLAGLS